MWWHTHIMWHISKPLSYRISIVHNKNISKPSRWDIPCTGRGLFQRCWNVVVVIPEQNGLTHQTVQHWRPFQDLKLTFVVSRRASSTFTHSRSSLTLLWTLSFGQRWPTSSLRKRIPLDVSYGSSQWVDWFRSGLITEMRPGLLVSDRPFFSRPLEYRIPFCRRCRSQSLLVVARRSTTGQLILLTSFTQHTKWKHNWCLWNGVSDVGTLSWMPTS